MIKKILSVAALFLGIFACGGPAYAQLPVIEEGSTVKVGFLCNEFETAMVILADVLPDGVANSNFTFSIMNNDCAMFPALVPLTVVQVMAIEADFEGDRVYVVQFTGGVNNDLIAYSVVWGNRLVGYTPGRGA